MAEPILEPDAGSRTESIDSIFASLASGERRHVLRVLAERETVPVDELVATLAPETASEPRADEPTEDHEQTRRTLHHHHLPCLDAAGLLAYDTDEAVVERTGHPAYDDAGIRAVIEDEPADPASADALFEALAYGRRRTVLDVLSHQVGAIHLETLARELGTDGRDMSESELPASAVDRILRRLYHADLGPLVEAGVVSYDPEEEMVAYEGHPVLRVPWMHSVLEPEFRQHLTGESEPQGIGVVDGREQVISFGQSLCDRADQELFCLFTDSGLLEAGCLTRIRDASRERDVEVYLGTRDQTVTEYVEEHAPAVIVWEPNTDWLNLPVEDNRVGRLLMADREAVMLGTLGEQTEQGFAEEQAMVGEGSDNSLVVMLRQMLGPHIEHIDDEPEDVEAHLPL
jgi:DNA-binding transcriptional ArsR family regulator